MPDAAPSALSEQLEDARRTSPDVDAVLGAYEELDRVYRESLIAMGQLVESDVVVGNSADVTIDLRHTGLTDQPPG